MLASRFTRYTTCQTFSMASSTPQPGTVEPPVSIDQLTNSEWAKPEYKLPIPSLQFLFHLECDMESFRHIGNGPHGDRSTVIFKGGRFEGPRLRGRILPGGGGGHNVPFCAQSIQISNQSLCRLGDREGPRWRSADCPPGYKIQLGDT